MNSSVDKNITNKQILKPERDGLLDKILDDIIRQITPQVNRIIEIQKEFIEKNKWTISAAQDAIKSLKATEYRGIILPPIYDKQNEGISEENLQRIVKIIINRVKPKNKAGKIKIFITRDFYLHKGNNKNKCKLEGQIQMKILKTINKNYIDTKTLCFLSGSKSEKSVRKTIGLINRKGKNHLKLNKKIILSERSVGYRLNPEYKLIFS